MAQIQGECVVLGGADAAILFGRPQMEKASGQMATTALRLTSPPRWVRVYLRAQEIFRQGLQRRVQGHCLAKTWKMLSPSASTDAA